MTRAVTRAVARSAPRARRTLLLCAALAGSPLGAPGCAGGHGGPLPLVEPWPTRPPGDYDDVYQRWTRRGRAYRELVETVGVSATLLAPELRAAYLEERARRLALPGDEQARLAAAESDTAAEFWEVELLLYTSRPDLNDLRKWAAAPQAGKPGSMWRLALVGDGGREVLPVSVKPDRRHREDVQAYYRDLRAFYQPYLVRFPAKTADGRPLVGPKGQLTLIVGSSIGRVDLVWSAE